jgi:hypothetical protein
MQVPSIHNPRSFNCAQEVITLVCFSIIEADPVAARHLDDASVEVMAFDLNDATVDLEKIEDCAVELLRRKHQTGAVARLIDRAINTAKMQRSAWE